MIFVDHASVAVPAILHSKEADMARKAAQEYFKPPLKLRRQQRFSFNPKIWVGCLKDLATLFSGKCGYCESVVDRLESANVDHFRPKSDSIDLKGKSSPDGYWWLAYEWQNLRFGCEICNTNKRNQFPVSGKRAESNAGLRGLAEEHAYLLDPCSDTPENFLQFDEKGHVTGKRGVDIGYRNRGEKYWGENRGAITVEILGLNRSELVAKRSRAFADLKESWAELAVDRVFGPAERKRLLSILDPKLPYLGLRYYFLRSWSLSLYQVLVPESRPRFVACLRHISPELVALHERGEKAAAPAVRRLRPTKPKPTPGIAHIESGSIRTITIKNFKAIRNLSITLPTGKSERAGWKMLLGENGTGKSSVLQAIAFALMGPELFATHLKRFKLYPKDLLRRKRDGKPANQALIEVEFTTDEKAVLRITKKDFHFITSLKKRFFVRGYGATRLLPRRDAPSQTVKTGIPHKIDNLLSPVVPVFNANDWLVGLRRKQFDSAALALKDLLNLPGRTNISIKARRVLIPINGIRISLDELSAGFESVLSMVADIIAGVVGGSHDLRHAPGIILLDEIDAHLHPRWKMRIVEALRGTFSSMQFIVTTHEPLCLRGLNENEVVVLRRENNELVSLDDLDSPSKLRVDQLLTSELFGLQSTLDPQLDEALSNYYRLLAKPDGELTSKEGEKLEELRKELPPVRVVELLGDSQRERLIYEVVDKYLANELAHRNPTARQEMKMQTRENVKKRIADIWRSTTTSTTRSEE